MPEELPLEPDLIKVLAADTRREILSLLQDRRMTVTELSRELDLGKATVHEHLNKLTEAGLVERQEDDRLWVYYRLTGRGKRLLNPQRTRFYLALASALVAALVAGLAVYGFMMTGGVGGADPTASPAGEGALQTAVVPTDDEIYAGDAIEVPARIQGDEEVQTYLVDEDSASRIREGDLGAPGLPMRAFTPTEDAGAIAARGNATLLRADASLEPGTYYLYARGDAGDNAPTMPSIRLVGLEAATDRSTWYQDLDRGPLEIQVTRAGAPANGTLRLAGGPQTGTSPTASLDAGQARLPAGTLDDLTPGTYRISVQPEDANRWIDLPTSLAITRPSLATLPLHVPEGEASVRVHLEGPDRLHRIEPTVTDAEATVRSHDTGWSLGLQDADPGSVSIQLARTTTSLAVHPSLGLQAEVHDGPEVHWTVHNLDGEPIEDAAVYVDGRSRGFTDAEGTLVTDLPEEGTHRLGIHRPDGHAITRAIAVDGWRLEDREPSVSLTPVDVAATGAHADVTVELSNDGSLDRPVTLFARLAGSPVATRGLEIPAGDTQQANLTVPVDAGRQEVTVEAQVLSQGPFSYANETTREEDAQTDSSSDGSSGGDVTAEDAADDSVDSRETTTVEVGATEAAMDAEQVATSQLEPVGGASSDGAVADGEATESVEAPAATLLGTVLALTVAALTVGRARKP